jgi:signal transduction histidine kinase
MLMLGVLVVYAGLAAWFLATQRQALFVTAQQVDSHHAAQELLEPSFNMLAHTLVQVQSILNGPEYSSGVHATYADIGTSLDPLMDRLDPVRDFDSTLAPFIESMQAAVDDVRAVPSGANLTAVRDAEQQLIAHLNDLLAALQHRTETLTERYHAQQQLLSVTAVGTSIVGALATAAVILVFFTQLARDLERLRARAVEIVSGYAGEPLVNGRSDEVGALIDAVNRMQVDLRRWERQIEINRQQRFHQEKMAAVGSMAAAIGHEVSNPIAAIAGVAQYLIDETKDDPSRNSQLAHDFSVQILRQTERISLIMRQLAGLTRTHSPEPELLDLNSLAQSTGGFIAFDKRFRGIEIEYRLDHDLPAVIAVTDHITQVLMNLLINAADAMEEIVEPRPARIVIATHVRDAEVCLDVTDTGHGMTPGVLSVAFDEGFTTKPAGRGRGIGLFLSKTLMTQANGRIEATSIPDVGTTMTLVLPPAVRDEGGR